MTERIYPLDLNGKRTTKEQWDAYEKELTDFRVRMMEKKPYRTQFETTEEYNKALSEWSQSYSMDRPNEPGYYRASND